MVSSERYKGHDQVLEALTRLPEARLVAAGDGDDRPRLESKAAALGMGDRIFFTGFLSEATLAELYRRCSAFVMPSKGEGFGLVYLEAMRAGKPVLAARDSAAEEIVEDGETGVLVDPEDREGLRAALAQLLGYPGEARRMGEAGRERWRQEFGAERFRERLEPLLERLVG
jgi:phosphatidylinositol alpha-1,6-mannosyltransferase